MSGIPLFSLLSFGFLLGIKHSLEADHIAAVSTLITSPKSLRTSAFLGAAWGLGHTISLVLAGILIMTFNITVPQQFSLILEFLVGIMLMMLGIKSFHEIKQQKFHVHPHTHNGTAHLHLHSHAISPDHHHTHRSFAIGLIHGLAGSAALMLLVTSTVNSTTMGLLYIVIFSIGSIIGMILTGSALSLPFLFTYRFKTINLSFKYITATASITIGIMMSYHIGITGNLLT